MRGSRAAVIRSRALPLILLLAAGLQVAYGLLDRAPDYDEAYYLDLARGITRHGIPRPRAEDQAFLAHPPLFYYLESTLFHFGEPPLFVARLPASACSLLTLWLIYRLSRRRWDEARALWTTGILAVNPAFVYYSHSVYMESAVTCLGVLALTLWFQPGGAAPLPVLAGMAGGGAFLAKYLGAFFPMGILLSATPLGGRVQIRPAAWLLVTFLGTAALWPVFALSVSPERFFEGLAFFLSPVDPGQAAHSWRVAGLGRYLSFQAGVLTPTLLGLAVVGIGLETVAARGAKATPLSRRLLVATLAILLLFFLFCLATSRRDVKYLVPVLPLLAMYASAPIALLFRRHRTPVVRAALIAGLVLLLTPATWLYDPIGGSWHPNLVVFGVQRDGRYRDLMSAGQALRRIRPPGSQVLAEAKNSLLGYYGDLTAVDLWGRPWEQIESRLDGADFYLAASDAAYLDRADRMKRDARLAGEFELLAEYESDGITQALFRRVRPPQPPPP